LAFAFRRLGHAQALAACLPRQDHVYITTDNSFRFHNDEFNAFRSKARALAEGLSRQDLVYKTTDESFRFHKQKLDEMRCKLDSTENPRSFEKYPTPP